MHGRFAKLTISHEEASVTKYNAFSLDCQLHEKYFTLFNACFTPKKIFHLLGCQLHKKYFTHFMLVSHKKYLTHFDASFTKIFYSLWCQLSQKYFTHFDASFTKIFYCTLMPASQKIDCNSLWCQFGQKYLTHFDASFTKIFYSLWCQFHKIHSLTSMLVSLVSQMPSSYASVTHFCPNFVAILAKIECSICGTVGENGLTPFSFSCQFHKINSFFLLWKAILMNLLTYINYIWDTTFYINFIR